MVCTCPRIFLPGELRIIHGMDCTCDCPFCLSERKFYENGDRIEWNRKGFKLPESDISKLRGAFKFIAKLDNLVTGKLDRSYHIKMHYKNDSCPDGYPDNMCPIFYPGNLEKFT